MSPSATARLDAFTDAAFAFAVTLLVVGGAAPGNGYQALIGAMGSVPAFAIGFAIIGMFWWAHVRWRGFRGDGDWLSVVLTFVLVFVVLVYVHPLRAMSVSFADFLLGRGNGLGGDLGTVFTLYGAGFVSMSLVMLALFAEAGRNPDLDARHRRALSGERVIWAILVVTGLVSVTLALDQATERLAPLVYSSLPLTVGLFSWRFFGRVASAVDH